MSCASSAHTQPCEGPDSPTAKANRGRPTPNLATALEAMEKARQARSQQSRSSASPSRDSGSWNLYDSPRRCSPGWDSMNTVTDCGSRSSIDRMSSNHSWGERVSSSSSRQSRSSHRRKSSIDADELLDAVVFIPEVAPRSSSVGRGEDEFLHHNSWSDEQDLEHSGRPCSTAAGAPAPGAEDEGEDDHLVGGLSSPKGLLSAGFSASGSRLPVELPPSPCGLFLDRRKQNFMMGLQSTNKEAGVYSPPRSSQGHSFKGHELVRLLEEAFPSPPSSRDMPPVALGVEPEHCPGPPSTSSGRGRPMREPAAAE
eukprot:CAMPEP_0173391416 /NCGR_PEP_ID=MMETSP1356-20130122/18370_1 /TAXON_ID=77927 ORGANISM="Hemiselmis virescens, Strain PCC157" /NCGR_SAMPLE_ID=MMETSP1356 /ASSEMBLY_ACC=CAM_ASM_000847 /LENGTH=311 /DNA_ID=CAMNT_0014349043 /DNA_START=98 /DNA_END=1031 /DNA_ORIENTATION=-